MYFFDFFSKTHNKKNKTRCNVHVPRAPCCAEVVSCVRPVGPVCLFANPFSMHVLLHTFALALLFVPQGDCTKAKKELGWVPEITFKELVKDMMKSDIANVDAGNEHA